MNVNKLYVVSVIDNGETCDGFPRVLGIYLDLESAKKFINDDMELWFENHNGEENDYVSVYWDEFYAIDEESSTYWSVDEIDVSELNLIKK